MPLLYIKRGDLNLVEFIGVGGSIITEETDIRSAALTELDPEKVQLATMLENGESSIEGEEKLKRLKGSGHIRLDADICLALWKNKHLIPESWKEKVGHHTRYIFFDGTVLRRSDDRRCVLYLCWEVGEWFCKVYWLDNLRRAYDPSAILAA